MPLGYLTIELFSILMGATGRRTSKRIPSPAVLHKLASWRMGTTNHHLSSLIKRASVAMNSQRPKRQIKKPNRFSQSPSFVPLDPQVSEIPEVHRPKKRPLQAIPAKPIPEELFQSLPSKQREIPIYTSPLGYIKYKANTAATKASNKLFAFLLLFSKDYITRIIFATNSYAEYNQNELSCDILRE
jgi:hypothetical protein